MEKGVREHGLTFSRPDAKGRIQFFSEPTQHKSAGDLMGVAMVLRDYLSEEACWQCERWSGHLPCQRHGQKRWSKEERDVYARGRLFP